MSCTFVLNCSNRINWQSIVDEVANKPGLDILPDRNKLAGTKYQELFALWDAADLNYSSAKWTNYYPNDYSTDVAAIFEKLLGVTHIRSWISRIDPGFSAPWHYDIDDAEQEYLKLGTLRRFVCYIGKPAPGHISIVGNNCHYNETEGNVYEWDSYKEWHAGANVGLTPKYQFNFLAYC